ncbi:MAG: hypothetical protein AAF515_01375 [Pseudomonadota bacterium]
MDASNYFDLGDWEREIATDAAAAKLWFNRGLTWVYGFNHDEAVQCFERALEADAGCAMAHWGIAYAVGPNYNNAWEMFSPEERENCLTTAHSAIELGLRSADAVERALLDALRVRYPTDAAVEDFGPYNDAYADALGAVYADHAQDLDVASLYAEALMGRTPWALWDIAAGQPAEGASTEAARQVLEAAFASSADAWRHPGLLHMYIHLMEMSPTPELALPHGDRLATLVPDSGHLVHMATHIDVLCGEHHNVIHRNHEAARVDRKFTALRGAHNFYTVYRIHNVHFEAYGAMFAAQRQTALAAATELQALLPEDVVAFMPDFFEAFWGVMSHVQVRFGMWDSIIAQPLPADAELFSFTTALQRYARVVALANLARHEEAEAELQRFFEAQANVQDSRYMFNNPAAEVLKIAAQMAQGELRYKAGDIEAGFDHLRRADTLSSQLVYDEPWGWMQPPGHALAALLMEQERFDEAERVYRDDLGLTAALPRPCQHPNNIWALHGLHECLSRRDATNEIAHVKAQLNRMLARADVAVGSSCFCRGESR